MNAQRAGFSLVEALVAISLGALVLTAGVSLLRAQGHLAQNLSERSERNDALRTALLIMQAELRALVPHADVRAIARDSIAARIFRGYAIVCGVRDQNILVRYRGLRQPDPAKDSALQIGVENTASINFVAADSSACAHGAEEQVMAWALSERAPLGSMWLVFESGSYHLGNFALRYRRGGESRQPITNEVINDRLSGFTAIGDATVRGFAVTLHARRDGAVMQVRVPFLNQP